MLPSYWQSKRYISILKIYDLIIIKKFYCIQSYIFVLVSHVGKVHGGLYKAPTRKKEESEQLRGERDKIKFIDLRFERWQVVGLRKTGRRRDVP